MRRKMKPLREDRHSELFINNENKRDELHVSNSGGTQTANRDQSMWEKSRSIRIFISSTFDDMQEERDILIKRIFPQLRQICMERGVGFSEVDLRWGVTQEQAERGEVLPICLAEIENSRPYFIGLLGERYGWIPDSIPEELVAVQPWLAEYKERSITELEIVHGVLRNPAMADHAFFYFRKKASSPGPIEDDNKAKQEALKERIRKSGFPVREEYLNAEMVGELIFEDLKDVIDRQFPEQQMTWLENENLNHAMFSESRLKVYIGRPEYFNHLDEFSQANGQPLVILGTSGSGKSALLANWAARFHLEQPDTFLVQHYIGSSVDSTDCAAMLRRVILEIKNRYKLPDDVPGTYAELRNQFPEWLSMAGARGRLVLILDSLNQLENKDNALELGWLPQTLPSNVRLILSTLPGRSLEVLIERGWLKMTVQPLAMNERQQIIRVYLQKLYAKRLPEKIESYIACREQSSSPLFLHALLEELRVFGRHHELEKKVEHYLQARDTQRLYLLILERLEEDYDTDTRGMVGDALSLIWAARQGLSEHELLEILDLPLLSWAPLKLALQDSLITRSGQYTFFHDYLRQAVHEKYIRTAESEKQTRLKIHNYFKHIDDHHPIKSLYQNLGGMASETYLDYFHTINPRKIEEVPWQLAQAQEWQLLYNCLADLRFLKAVFAHDKYEVMNYWKIIEDKTNLSFLTAYEDVLKSPTAFAMYLPLLHELLNIKGYHSEAKKIAERLVEVYRSNHYLCESLLSGFGLLDEETARVLGSIVANRSHPENEGSVAEKGDEHRKVLNQRSLANSLLMLGDAHYYLGEYDSALNLYKEQEQICRQLDYKHGLKASLGNQGVVLQRLKNFAGAMSLHKEQESISKALGDVAAELVSYGNQSVILIELGDLKEAMALCKKQERLSREFGHIHILQLSLGNQGLILEKRNDLQGALDLYRNQEAICRELGSKRYLQHVLGGQGRVLLALGDYEDSESAFREQELICRETENKRDLLQPLYSQGMLFEQKGDRDGSMVYYKEMELICREVGDNDGLQQSLGKQGDILLSQGNRSGSLKCYQEQESICRRFGNKEDLQESLGSQGKIFENDREFDRALELYEEQEQICRELGDRNSLQSALNGQGKLLFERGDVDSALRKYEQLEKISRALEDDFSLQISLGSQGTVLKDRGELIGALELFRKQESVCRRIGEKDSLVLSLAGQRSILSVLGEFDQCMQICREEEQLCRDINNMQALQQCLGSQGIMYKNRNDFGHAMRLFKEQEQLCRELGNKEYLAAALGNQANILAHLGKSSEASKLYNEQSSLSIESGNRELQCQSKHNQGIDLYKAGDLDGAMQLFSDLELLCRQSGDLAKLGKAFLLQALILRDKEQFERALTRVREAHECAVESGDTGLLNLAESMLASFD